MSASTEAGSLFTDKDSSEILDFWFKDVPEHPHMEMIQRWFQPNPAFDDACRANFGPLLSKISPLPVATVTALATTPQKTLSLLLLLDQIPRNIHRADSRSVYTVTDPLALAVAQHATSPALRLDLGPEAAWKGFPMRRCWFYLPFSHGEDMSAHRRAAELHEELVRDCKGGEGEKLAVDTEGFLNSHTQVIERFGRYPYRNQILGRESTKEEIEWLEKDKPAWAR
ncbi:unnamed protein product [Tuber melanosporum]|jgi:uncharacterized protein (DUF924 family)|uniref:(Perigord truffle) hypothetical protein n=1 Tax=Tuber melanosporum (strain Mel28) TaxID=656061 RepID=D5GG13_TUBMM|nr:uncharacterized protein GSTUM_00007149001 [Tuber melanosporum]CAZ83456.1 unnamed protein product [Tuber melanosporum]